MRLVCLLAIVSVVAVSQICWARCICDPSDRLCLDNCVNNARECIEGCRDTLCFTDCINIHWPGTTFEQLNSEYLQVQDASSQEELQSSPISEQSDNFTVDSAFASDELSVTDNKEMNGASTKETNTMTISNTGFLTAPLSDIPSLLDAPSISFTTVHTTITSLITVTPAPSSSLMNNNATYTISLGSGSTYINSTNLRITLFILLSTTCILI